MSRKCPCALRKGAASCDVMWKRRYLREQRGLIRCALPFAARRSERATRHFLDTSYALLGRNS